jgi:hypothetical protein
MRDLATDGAQMNTDKGMIYFIGVHRCPIGGKHFMDQ